MGCEEFKILLMGYIDGELSGNELKEVEEHLKTCSGCQAEVKHYKKLGEVAKSIHLREPSDEEWEKFWSNIYNRMERNIGWIFTVAGIITLGIYTIYRIVFSQDLSLTVKTGILSLVFGFFVLFISVLRGQFAAQKHDRYKDVRR